MATDRTTLPRGSFPNSQQRTATSPAGRRLPGAPRERKPVLAALAVLLIAAGAAVSALLVVQTGHRVPAIEISQPIGAGQPIPLSAMQEVQISADSGLAYVAWSQRDQVAQYFAGAAIPPGTLLTAKMVVRANNLISGLQVIGLTLKPGQVPAALQVGDHVDIYDTNTTTQNSCPGLPGSVLTRNAIITNLMLPSASSGNSNIGVDIAINPADAGVVTCNAANNWTAVAIMPANAQGQPSAAPPVPAPSPNPGRPGVKKRRAVVPTATATPTVPASPTVPALPGTG
jgi:hypothetical protein